VNTDDRQGTIGRRGVTSLVAIAALLVAMVLPAQALAGDPTEAQYASPVVAAGNVGGGGLSEPGTAATESVPVTPTTTANNGALPFTGLDVAALALVAMALAGTGLALRRLSAAGGEANR
jgi:hypothetical protein